VSIVHKLSRPRDVLYEIDAGAILVLKRIRYITFTDKIPLAVFFKNWIFNISHFVKCRERLRKISKDDVGVVGIADTAGIKAVPNFL